MTERSVTCGNLSLFQPPKEEVRKERFASNLHILRSLNCDIWNSQRDAVSLFRRNKISRFKI